MIHLNNYITEKLQLKTGVQRVDYDYRFKVLLHYPKNGRAGDKYDQMIKFRDHYKKTPEEINRRLQEDILVDKFLYDHMFKQRDVKYYVKFSKDYTYGGMYYVTTPFNRNNVIVIYDFFGGGSTTNYNFLVCKSPRANGKTLVPLEFVEPEELTEIIHDENDDDVKKVPIKHIDNIEDAWKYIEGKYGRF